MNHVETPSRSSRSGFTLAELLLAMLVFSIAITTILALLARSIETVDEILVKDEAMRLSAAVEDFFERRAFTDTNPTTGPGAYEIINSGGNINIMAYMYRADPNTPRPDGTLTPRASREGTPEVDFVIVPGVRPFIGSTASPELQADMTAREGRLYLVRLSVSPNNPEPLRPSADDYPSAAVVFYAEFFPVPDVNNANPEALGIPSAYSFHFAVRR